MGLLDRFRKKIPTTPSPAAKDGAVAAVKKLAKPEAGEGPAALPSGASELASRLLVKPHVSEKAARLAQQGVYVFDVSLDAEKVAIRKAVESLYKVQVTSVHTVRHAGKPVYRGRRAGARKAWKKALVTLAKGQSISLYEGV
jgi:large subunit ribosomal protein L23